MLMADLKFLVLAFCKNYKYTDCRSVLFIAWHLTPTVRHTGWPKSNDITLHFSNEFKFKQMNLPNRAIFGTYKQQKATNANFITLC